MYTSRRSLVSLVSTCLLAASSAASAYDFSLGVFGPKHAVRGYTVYLQIDASLLEGERDYIFYGVAGLPPGSSVFYPWLDEFCCGGNRGWEPSDTLVKVALPPAATPGPYELEISAVSGGVSKAAFHTLVVDPVPGPLPSVPITVVAPLSRLAAWEQNMVSAGSDHCDPVEIQNLGLWEGSVWYYDGTRVYYQIADYTGDPSWENCARYARDVYRPYVLSNNGGIGGWRVFPHGLTEDYARTGEVASRNAAVLLAENSAYARWGGAVHPNLVRETAYVIHAYRIARRLGEAEHRHYQRAVAYGLGHIDQWFVSQTEPYMQPFMVGLLCEALIQYYEESSDPRVPPAIKTALDGIWDWAWVPEDKSFFYESTGDTANGAPDLNLLIAPAYAWLYSITGDPLYRQRGDLVFEGGVDGAWLGGGKQFSQNYRWSFDFVRWRLGGQPIFADGFESGSTSAWN